MTAVRCAFEGIVAIRPLWSVQYFVRLTLSSVDYVSLHHNNAEFGRKCPIVFDVAQLVLRIVTPSGSQMDCCSFAELASA